MGYAIHIEDKFCKRRYMLSEQGEATRGGPTKRGNIGPTSRKINQTATAMGKNRLYDLIHRVTLCALILLC
jgi:hypothetical protein